METSLVIVFVLIALLAFGSGFLIIYLARHLQDCRKRLREAREAHSNAGKGD